ncbi:MAG: CHAT domain-containing protein [Oscillatoria sp. SIO1A7]|nr:CHAT domain-containing protein [Oscillatoria sp. SIO1A7]
MRKLRFILTAVFGLIVSLAIAGNGSNRSIASMAGTEQIGFASVPSEEAFVLERARRPFYGKGFVTYRRTGVPPVQSDFVLERGRRPFYGKGFVTYRRTGVPPVQSDFVLERARRPFYGKGFLKNLSQTRIAKGDRLLLEGKNRYDGGQFSEAARVWQEAAEVFSGDGLSLGRAQALAFLSLAYQRLGQYQEAKAAIASSKNILNSISAANASSQIASSQIARIRGQIFNAEGRLYFTLGQAESALAIWQEATLAYSSIADLQGEIISQINQAGALQVLGMYRRANAILEKLAQILEEKPDNLLKAASLRTLGDLRRQVGSLEESAKILQQALAVAERVGDKGQQGAILIGLGNTIRGGENPAEALEFYQQAIAIASEMPILKTQAQLNRLSLLVETAQWDAAENAAAEIREPLANMPPSRQGVYAQVNLAKSLVCLNFKNANCLKPEQGVWSKPVDRHGIPKLEKPPKPLFLRGAFFLPLLQGGVWGGSSATTFDRTPEQVGKHLPETEFIHAKIIPMLARGVKAARQLEDKRAESYTLGNLSRIYEEIGEDRRARQYAETALNIAQFLQASDISYQWQWQLGRLLASQGDIKGAIAAYSEAVNTLQSLRGDLVAIDTELQFSFRQKVEPVYRQLVGLLLDSAQIDSAQNYQNNSSQNNNAQNCQGTEDKPQCRKTAEEYLQKARQTIEALQLAELDNYFRDACLDAKPQQIDRVDPQAAAIYPIILPDRLAVILSIPGQPLRHYQTELQRAKIETTLGQFQQFLSPAFSNKQRLRLAQEIYDWLIRPAEMELEENNIETLVFVLDGLLRNLPMAALHDGDRYLIEKYSIALTPGLQLLDPRPLARDRFRALTGGLTEARQGFNALPAVAWELEQIASNLPVEQLLDSEFTKSKLLGEIDEVNFTAIHLATHGQFSSNPEQTFILTWDSKIKVRELENLLKMRAEDSSKPIELLVLSACQTAAGDKRAGLGLAGVAVRSGARSTLATLWSVNDRSTATLMGEFYQNLLMSERESMTKAEALRRAQLKLLRNSKYQHPFYWAPFVLVGNWL